MTNSNSAPSLLVGKGAVESASYRDPLISSYRGNPLIEALPPILSKKEAVTLLAHYPSYDQNERTLPNHLRFHLVRNALKFVEPLPIHLDLEQRFSCMIRTGYEARNPVTPEFRRDFQKRLNALDSDGLPQKYIRSTATGFTIIGISGVGKTTAVEAILSIYPQVIVHSHYRDRDFTLMQIVWLKLDCPFDGSIKGLCLNFFQAVDDLLGTNYSTNYGRGRFTVDQLIPCHALYDVTQGITDFAVKVYMLAQARASATGKEVVTENIIRSVAKDSLRLAQPILSALKTGDIRFLQSVEDVHPIDITSFLEEAQKTTKIVGRLRSSPTIQKSLEDSEEVEVHLRNPAPDSPTTEAGCNSIDVTPQPEIKKRQRKPRKSALQKEGLMKVVAFGEEEEIAAYQALKQEGYIRPATEYLPEEVVR